MAADGFKRVAILISGRGSNMSALIAACMDPAYPGRVVGVISNKPDAGGLQTAARYGIETRAIDQREYDSREDHDAAVMAALDAMKPDVVCLAGYMRLLSAPFVRRYSGRMINIHPSLLPLFPGLRTHERVLDSGMRVHGCTVHFVTDGMDEGPIIAQAAIAVAPGDTADTLSERLLRAEHRLYPHGLRLVLDGAARMSNGSTVFAKAGSAGAGDDASSLRETADPVRIGDDLPILLSPDARRSA